MKLLIFLIVFLYPGTNSAQVHSLKNDSAIALTLTIDNKLEAYQETVPQKFSHNNETGYRKNKGVIIAVIIGALLLIAILK